jgi:23S rRNA pseudouridine1911/1915/1917 synthase
MNSQTYHVEDDCRLDQFLTTKIDNSRSAIANLIKKGGITRNDREVTKPSAKLHTGDTVIVTFPEMQKDTSETQIPNFDVDIIYEDDDILVISKPPHVVVHPAPSYKEPTLVDWLKYKGYSLSTLSGEERHGIVHRLDKETSGAMVIAKNDAAHQKLSDQLTDRSMGRYYLALLDQSLKEDCIVTAPIARNRANRLKMGIVASGKSAKSAFMKIHESDFHKYELIAAKLFTGRTHQIRVHLGLKSRHIMGDELYGFNNPHIKVPRVMLHAYLLYLIHPTTGELCMFEAPIPADFMHTINTYITKESLDEKLNKDFILNTFNTSA